MAGFPNFRLVTSNLVPICFCEFSFAIRRDLLDGEWFLWSWKDVPDPEHSFACGLCCDRNRLHCQRLKPDINCSVPDHQHFTQYIHHFYWKQADFSEQKAKYVKDVQMIFVE